MLSPVKIKLRRTIKNLKLKHKHLVKKCVNLKDLLDKNKHLIEAEAREHIEITHEGETAFLFENQLKNRGRKPGGHRYDDKLKSFALTLHYYSPKAYNYVRLDFLNIYYN